MNALPDSWAAWAAVKEREEPEEEWNQNGWIDDRATDERLVKLEVDIQGYAIAKEANALYQKQYRVLVPPDRLRELGTRRHKWLDAAHRSRYKTADPLVPYVIRFHAGAVCLKFLSSSAWSWLMLQDEVQERIDAGKGTLADLVFLSEKTALISRLWDEHEPKVIDSLRLHYSRDRSFSLPDQERLKMLREDLLYLADRVRE